MDPSDLGTVERGFALLDRASTSAVVTVRDDEQEFAWLIDAARVSRRRGARFRLVDSGQGDIVSLCRLAEAGAEIYSSDEARPDSADFIPVALSGRGHASPTYYYIYGPATEGAEPAAVRPALLELGRSGTGLHLSNRDRKRSAGELVELARACRQGSARLVYYHLGDLDPLLETLSAEGGWVHWIARDLDNESAAFLLADILGAAKKAGGGLVLHVEDASSVLPLRRALRSGAFLVFHTAPSERSSDLRRLEAASKRRRPDPCAYYLHENIMP